MWALGALIGFTGVLLAEVSPGFTVLWSILTVTTIAALFSARGVSWLRQDLPADARFGASPRKAGRAASLVFVAALAFQLLRWVGDGGALSAKPGDDDEGYIFLAYQALGYFGSPPVFAFRMPGWPLIIAGLVRLVGDNAIWVVGLYQRLLLAAVPPLVFLLLGRYLRLGVAATAALSSLAMRYNDRMATVALTDLSYSVASLVALVVLVIALGSGRPGPGVAVAGAFMAAKTLVRLTGLAVTLGGGVGLLVVGLGCPSRRLGQALLFVAPAFAAVLGVSAYHQAVSGHFKPSMGGSIIFLSVCGPHLGQTPDTPAVSEIASLIPEMPPLEILSLASTPWLAHYRFGIAGRGDSFDFGALGDRATREIVMALPGEYVAGVGRALVAAMLYPIWTPARWGDLPPPRFEPTLRDNLPVCNLQWGLGPFVQASWCTEHEKLRAGLRFQPAWLAATPKLHHPARRVANNLTGPLRRLAWPLYFGLTAFAAVVYLVTRPATRGVAVLLGLTILSELLLPILFAFLSAPRFLVHVHMLYFLTVWLALAMGLDALTRLRASRMAPAQRGSAKRACLDPLERTMPCRESSWSLCSFL